MEPRGTPEAVADYVAERAKKNPRVRETIRDAHLFDSLQEHDGWKRLAERVRADRERFFANLARRLMKGEAIPQGEIDFHRGFYQGAEWVIGHPEEAEKSLERAASRAWREAESELARRRAEATR
jgi:hypothetical protein